MESTIGDLFQTVDTDFSPGDQEPDRGIGYLDLFVSDR